MACPSLFAGPLPWNTMFETNMTAIISCSIHMHVWAAVLSSIEGFSTVCGLCGLKNCCYNCYSIIVM
jgi:hypothetical protein